MNKKNRISHKNSNINIKKSIIRRNVITLSTSFALMIVALIATILVLRTNNIDKKFMAYEGYYNSDQTTLDTSTVADDYIKMSEMYTISGSSVDLKSGRPIPETDQYISIETLDGWTQSKAS